MNKWQEIKIGAAVLKALEGADMSVMTEGRVRDLASKETGIDLSQQPYRQRVQELIVEFLESENVVEEEEEASDVEEKLGRTSKEYVGSEEDEPQHNKAKPNAKEHAGSEEDEPQHKKVKPTAKPTSKHVVTQKVKAPGGSKAGESRRMEDGSLMICQLTPRRSITVSDWKGTKLVAIRESYEKDGKTLPGKGISLNRDQWNALKEGFADIDAAIQTLKGDR